MRKLTRTTLAATAVAGLLAVPATGATANPDDSTITFTVTNTGTLSVAMDDGGLGTFDSASATEAAGALPEVTVTDASNPLESSYNVTAQSSSFVGGTTGHTIAASDVSYWSGLVTGLVDAGGGDLLSLDPSVALVVAACQQPLAGNAVAIDTAQTAVVVSTATGNHTLRFTPNLIVDLTGVPADTYSGTITHSAS